MCIFGTGNSLFGVELEHGESQRTDDKGRDRSRDVFINITAFPYLEER